VRVSVYELETHLLLLERLVGAGHHVRGLAGMARAPDSEVVIGRWDLEDLEEHTRHVFVVVLTRVNQDFLVMLSDLAADGRGLNELRPRTDDARDFHES